MIDRALTCLSFVLLYVYGTDSLIVKKTFIRRDHNSRERGASSHDQRQARKASSTVESVIAAVAETTESVQQDYSKYDYVLSRLNDMTVHDDKIIS